MQDGLRSAIGFVALRECQSTGVSGAWDGENFIPYPQLPYETVGFVCVCACALGEVGIVSSTNAWELSGNRRSSSTLWLVLVAQ